MPLIELHAHGPTTAGICDEATERVAVGLSGNGVGDIRERHSRSSEPIAELHIVLDGKIGREASHLEEVVAP